MSDSCGKGKVWGNWLLDFHEFSSARLIVEAKYAVKFSITDFSNFIGNAGNVIMATYGKVTYGLRYEGVDHS